MDQERLKEELRRHALRVVEKVSADMPPTLRRFGDVEKALKEATEELGKEWLQSWCDEAKDDSLPPRCPHCGGRMRQKEQLGKPRRRRGRGGDVTVKRKRWWCGKCGESFFPSGQRGDGRRSGDQP